MNSLSWNILFDTSSAHLFRCCSSLAEDDEKDLVSGFDLEDPGNILEFILPSIERQKASLVALDKSIESLRNRKQTPASGQSCEDDKEELEEPTVTIQKLDISNPSEPCSCGTSDKEICKQRGFCDDFVPFNRKRDLVTPWIPTKVILKRLQERLAKTDIPGNVLDVRLQTAVNYYTKEMEEEEEKQRQAMLKVSRYERAYVKYKKFLEDLEAKGLITKRNSNNNELREYFRHLNEKAGVNVSNMTKS